MAVWIHFFLLKTSVSITKKPPVPWRKNPNIRNHPIFSLPKKCTQKAQEKANKPYQKTKSTVSIVKEKSIPSQ